MYLQYSGVPGHHWDQQKSSLIERVSSGQGFIIDHMGYNYLGFIKVAVYPFL